MPAHPLFGGRDTVHRLMPCRNFSLSLVGDRDNVRIDKISSAIERCLLTCGVNCEHPRPQHGLFLAEWVDVKNHTSYLSAFPRIKPLTQLFQRLDFKTLDFALSV